VPATEFPRFLTACADALPRDRYRRVEHHYHQLRIAAAAVLADHHQPEEVLAFTRRALRDATSTGHAIVICRAVTAAAFAHRVLLSANAATLAAALNHEPWFAARTNPRWSHLHRLRRPEHAAVAVLAACGLDAATIAGLTMADLDGLLMTAPDPARCHLRRLELHRLAQGADSTDGLLALADQRPVTARWVRTTHLAVTRDFDPPGADSAPHRRVREPDHLWARRLGIRVRVIT
jgi:hypothetical protein